MLENEEQPDTFDEKMERFVLNHDGTFTDTKTGLMWDCLYSSGQWSTQKLGTDVPDGDMFTSVLASKIQKPVTLPARTLSFSETGKYVDTYSNEEVTIGDEPQYDDWRVPDVRELQEMHNNFDWVRYKDQKDGKAYVQDAGLSFKHSGAWFWTSTLVRVDKNDTPTEAWAVSWDRPKGRTDADGLPIKSETPSSGKGPKYLETIVVTKKVATSESLGVRLVRGEEKIDHDPSITEE